VPEAGQVVLADRPAPGQQHDGLPLGHRRQPARGRQSPADLRDGGGQPGGILEHLAGEAQDQHADVCIVLDEAVAERLGCRRRPQVGVGLQQLAEQVAGQRAVAVLDHETLPQDAGDGLGGRDGIRDLGRGHAVVGVDDPQEPEQAVLVGDGHGEPGHQLQLGLARQPRRRAQGSQAGVVDILGAGPAVQQRPDAGRIGVAEVLAGGQQAQRVVIDGDPAAEAGTEGVDLVLQPVHGPDAI